MGQILADAGADFEHPVYRRGGVGDGGVVAEILMDAPHQFQPPLQDRPSGGKAFLGIDGDVALKRRERRIEDELHGVDLLGLVGRLQRGAHRFPALRVLGVALRRRADPHLALGQNFQHIVRLIQGEPFGLVAEIIGTPDARGRRRVQRQLAGDHLLQRRFAQTQMGDVAGIADILQIAIGGAVADQIFHQLCLVRAAAPVRLRPACWK